MANAKEKKEIDLIDSKEVTVEKINLSVDVTIEKGIFETTENDTLEEDLFFGCGSEGNDYYDELMQQPGMTHRVARSLRRDHVRDCRGGTWTWLNYLGFIAMQ
jgi:hypothetical protein